MFLADDAINELDRAGKMGMKGVKQDPLRKCRRHLAIGEVSFDAPGTA